MKLAILIGAHNRRDTTRRCLESIERLRLRDAELVCYVVDDGSTDGTSQMIARTFPHVVLLSGDGSLYWGGAMRKAEARALADGADRLIWMNDDADFCIPRLQKVLEDSCSREDSEIICCAFSDPVTGALTYSGIRAELLYGMFFRTRRVPPHSSRYTEVDTFNGNCVVVPSAVARRLGSIDPALRHHYGDFDYGLRARQFGATILLAPGVVGTTARNGRKGTFRDASLGVRSRVALLFGPKGYPIKEKRSYLRRHNPRFWWLQLWTVYAAHTVTIFGSRLVALILADTQSTRRDTVVH